MVIKMNWKEKYLNKVICGDCLSVLKELPDKCVDLVFTDPPYEYISDDRGLIGGGFMKNESRKHLDKIKETFGIRYVPQNYLNEIKRISKNFNTYLFTNKTLLKEYINFAEENQYKWEILIWAKENPIPIFNEHYMLDKEYIIFMRGKGSFFNSRLNYKKYFTFRYYPIGFKKTNHPTEKPLFIADFIEISTKKDDIIFDGYLGSGTTAVACERLKRNWIGIEISPEYCKIAEERIKKERDQLKLAL